MINLTELHKRTAPDKWFQNFYRSRDFKSAVAALPKGEDAICADPSGTMCHKLVAAAYLHWADPVKFYKRLGNGLG